MSALLGFKPTPDDLAQFKHLRGHLQRQAAGEEAITNSTVLRHALRAATGSLAAQDAPDVQHGPLSVIPPAEYELASK